MKIEIWTDYSCPFCYIGKRNLETALGRFAHSDRVEVIYRSFELSPDAKRHTGQSLRDVLIESKGMSGEQVDAMLRDITQHAEAVRLPYHFDTVIPTNTFDAHRLTHFAAAQGLAKEMAERIFKAYFTDSLDIGDANTLTQLASEIGLDAAKVSAVLNSDEYAQAVRSDEQESQSLGIRSVPFFVFNRKYALSGAQPAEMFEQALNTAWAEEIPAFESLNQGEPGLACTDDACELE